METNQEWTKTGGSLPLAKEYDNSEIVIYRFFPSEGTSKSTQR